MSEYLEIIERLSKLEQKVADLDKKVDQLIILLERRNGYTLKILKIVIIALLVAMGIREALQHLIG